MPFDFLVNGELVRITLGKLLLAQNLSTVRHRPFKLDALTGSASLRLEARTLSKRRACNISRKL